MTPFDAPQVGMLATVAGLGLLVTIVVEIILRAWQPDGQTKDRFGPILALGVALFFAVLAALTQGLDVVEMILTAVVTAGTGMGIHDTVDSQTTP